MTIQAPEIALAKTIIPAEFHDRPYLKDWLDKPVTPEFHAEVFKKLDGAEALIGKKTLIPGADAKPEEWDQFLAKLRPEKAEEYDYKFGEKADPDFVKTFREAAHAAGMSKVQVQKQLEKLAPFFMGRDKAKADEQAANDAKFNDMVKAAVGPEYEQKLAIVQAALREYAPASTKEFIGKLDPAALTLVVGAVHGILAKYASEDDLAGLGKSKTGANGGAVTKETLIAEAQAIYANPAWKNFQHPDHAKLVARNDEIFAHEAFK